MRLQKMTSATLFLFILLLGATSGQSTTRARGSFLGFAGSREAHIPESPWAPPTVKPTLLLQLHNITFDHIRQSTVPFYILDAHEANFTQDQVTQLRAQNKTLLAYLSLGVAERHRRYWQPFWLANPPDFLIQPLQSDSLQYRVEFWRPQWQRIVLRFMREHILPFGFTGLFLDGLDAYQTFADEDHDARAEMIGLIRLARNQARALVPGTVIYANNVPELYELSEFQPLVEGLAVTDVWYQNDTDVATTMPQVLENMVTFMRQAKRDGKVVLAVDFPRRSENVCAFYDKCSAEGFFCQVTDYGMTGVTRLCPPKPKPSSPGSTIPVLKPGTTGGDKFPSTTSGSTSSTFKSSNACAARTVEILLFCTVGILHIIHSLMA